MRTVYIRRYCFIAYFASSALVLLLGMIGVLSITDDYFGRLHLGAGWYFALVFCAAGLLLVFSGRLRRALDALIRK